MNSLVRLLVPRLVTNILHLAEFLVRRLFVTKVLERLKSYVEREHFAKIH